MMSEHTSNGIKHLLDCENISQSGLYNIDFTMRFIQIRSHEQSSFDWPRSIVFLTYCIFEKSDEWQTDQPTGDTCDDYDQCDEDNN